MTAGNDILVKALQDTVKEQQEKIDKLTLDLDIKNRMIAKFNELVGIMNMTSEQENKNKSLEEKIQSINT